ncbi:hypothetical protein HK100_002674 [Physocladia obscura]|uniref:Adenylate kinase active site lid domain-containing protein n=1 Tax=Physocladia obscura TaxID=109957 RepID=A0AAD5T119_9FUNG|nr:hypothetical protein HK100_002674 [Physocladia obscura]
MRTVVFFGAPGSGKGTLASRTAKHHGLRVVSSGDALRNHVHRRTTVGVRVAEVLAAGRLVDDAIVADLMFSELHAASQDRASLLLDGFPRSLHQAEWLADTLPTVSRSLDAVVNLDVPERVILGRIENRWIHAPSGRTYNYSFNPPKTHGLDDITGERLTKRADDDIDTFKARIAKFNDTTTPILEYYHSKGILNSFKGETSDQLFPQIDHKLGHIFGFKQ